MTSRSRGSPTTRSVSTKLRVGVLGMGFMGGTHSIAWRNGKSIFNWPVEIEMRALFDMSEDSLALNGGRFEFARTTKDWRDVCEADDIDVVSICTPNFAHREMAEAALAAGKHVWCEKPMATSMADNQAMVDAATSGRYRLRSQDHAWLQLHEESLPCSRSSD